MDPAENTASNEEVQEVSTDNVPGGESVTPEEVAELLHLPTQEAQDETEDEATDASDTTEDESTDESNDDDSADDVANDESTDDAESDESDEQESESTNESKADDSQFTLEIEDANGDKFTLRPGDNLEEALKNFEPKSNGQIMRVLNDFNKLEAQKAEHDKRQTEETSKAERAKRAAEIEAGWNKEIEALQGSKRLPVDASGKADQKRVGEVMAFMSAENDKRAKEGRPFVNSFEDALDKLELKELKDAEAAKEKEEKKLAKEKGAMVGGSSAPMSAGTPVYKGGARTAEDAAKMLGLY